MKNRKQARFILVVILISGWIGGCNLAPNAQLPDAPTNPPPAARSTATLKTPVELDTAKAHEESELHEQPDPTSILAEKLQGLEIDEFFEVSYRELLLREPELVLEMGLKEAYGLQAAELTNISDAYIRETEQIVVAILEMLRTYDRETLTHDQRVWYDVYEAYLDDRVRGQEFMYYDYPVTFFITGVQVQQIQFFTDIHPVETQQDAEDYITRLGLVDTKFEQLIEGLELRSEAGVIPPKFIIQWSLDGIQDIARSSAKRTPFYTAFQEKVNNLEEVSEADKQALLEAAEEAVNESVIPAYQALADYLEDLETMAPTDDGVWQFPNGDAYYAYLLRHHTSTDLTADEIYDLGEQEVARIQAEMRLIFDQLGYPEDESLPRLYERIAQDGGFVSGEQMVEAYETIIAQAEASLGTAFDQQPAANVIVIGGPVGGYYVPGSLDGSRPGAFYADTSSGSPRFSMATLAYHEAVPGHHLQIALAQETDLPSFRNNVSFTAYTEGWALYAEQLAWELGWYQDDPHGDLGRLQAEAFRAVRLVVDTGIHAKGWTFDQAVEYMVENTGFSHGMVTGQIARYVAWPGQATAYKIGMLKILELRQLAKDQLGDRFDLKEFHSLVLGNGSMPLDVLEEVVGEYIKTKLE